MSISYMIHFKLWQPLKLSSMAAAFLRQHEEAAWSAASKQPAVRRLLCYIFNHRCIPSVKKCVLSGSVVNPAYIPFLFCFRHTVVWRSLLSYCSSYCIVRHTVVWRSLLTQAAKRDHTQKWKKTKRAWCYTGPPLAGAGPNARPGCGAPLSSDFMTSSCSVNRVTIVVERIYTVKHLHENWARLLTFERKFASYDESVIC